LALRRAKEGRRRKSVFKHLNEYTRATKQQIEALEAEVKRLRTLMTSCSQFLAQGVGANKVEDESDESGGQ
jgi:prefoldin subunit 5